MWEVTSTVSQQQCTLALPAIALPGGGACRGQGFEVRRRRNRTTPCDSALAVRRCRAVRLTTVALGSTSWIGWLAIAGVWLCVGRGYGVRTEWLCGMLFSSILSRQHRSSDPIFGLQPPFLRHTTFSRKSVTVRVHENGYISSTNHCDACTLTPRHILPDHNERPTCSCLVTLAKLATLQRQHTLNTTTGGDSNFVRHTVQLCIEWKDIPESARVGAIGQHAYNRGEQGKSV